MRVPNCFSNSARESAVLHLSGHFRVSRLHDQPLLDSLVVCWLIHLFFNDEQCSEEITSTPEDFAVLVEPKKFARSFHEVIRLREKMQRVNHDHFSLIQQP